MLFPTTIAGSLPKPEWLAEPNTLWAPWKSKGDELTRAKRDATILAVKLQEDAGVFLQFYRQHGSVALGARQLVALRFPGRPQLVGLGQPFRLRQRAGDGGWKQHDGLSIGSD